MERQLGCFMIILINQIESTNELRAVPFGVVTLPGVADPSTIRVGVLPVCKSAGKNFKIFNDL